MCRLSVDICVCLSSFCVCVTVCLLSVYICVCVFSLSLPLPPPLSVRPLNLSPPPSLSFSVLVFFSPPLSPVSPLSLSLPLYLHPTPLSPSVSVSFSIFVSYPSPLSVTSHYLSLPLSPHPSLSDSQPDPLVRGQHTQQAAVDDRVGLGQSRRRAGLHQVPGMHHRSRGLGLRGPRPPAARAPGRGPLHLVLLRQPGRVRRPRLLPQRPDLFQVGQFKWKRVNVTSQ